jgi:hypothetical protein
MNDLISKKIEKALLAINNGTLKNVIKWTHLDIAKAPSLNGYESLNGQIYATEYINKKLCLYRYDTRVYIDEDAWHPDTAYKLMFITDENKTDWEFPSHRLLKDLYESVTYQIASVDDFFEKCIEELGDSDSNRVMFL